VANCEYFEELIGAALDGELTGAEEAALRAHLAECEACRAFAAALEAVSGAAERGLPPPPPELTERIMGAVRGEAKRKTGKLVPLFRYARPAALAAAAALVLWAGFRVSHIRMGSSAAAPAAPMMAESVIQSAAKADAAAEEAAEAEDAEVPMAPAPALGAAPAARDEKSVNSYAAGGAAFDVNEAGESAVFHLYRGETEELLAETPEDAALWEALVIDKPSPPPNREADYTLAAEAPDGTRERWLLWQEGDGLLALREETGESGWTARGETLWELLGREE